MTLMYKLFNNSTWTIFFGAMHWYHSCYKIVFRLLPSSFWILFSVSTPLCLFSFLLTVVWSTLSHCVCSAALIIQVKYKSAKNKRVYNDVYAKEDVFEAKKKRKENWMGIMQIPSLINKDPYQKMNMVDK